MQKTTDWRYVYRTGLLAGGAILYIGLVGMLAAFVEREVVRDTFTLAQLMLALIPFGAAFFVARRLRKEGATLTAIVVSALVVGFLSALPSLVLLFLTNTLQDMDDILVNVNRDWIETITFDNRNDQARGVLLLVVFLTVSSAVGMVLQLLPEKLRRALLYGSSFTLLIGVFGETVNFILGQLLPDDTIDLMFRRDTLLLNAAVVLFVISNVAAIIGSYSSKLVGQRYAAMPESNRNASRVLLWLVLSGLLLILPSLLGRSLSDVAVQVGLFVLMGFGLNIAIGLAGLLDLGYVTNYAVGAYVMAVLTSTGLQGRGGDFFTFWLVIPIALLAAMFAGFIFAVPVLKMRGDYLAIATLGFGEIIGKLAVSDWLAPVIGGAQGILRVPKPMFFGTELVNPEQLYYIVLAACVITLFISIRLNNSRIGRQWMAIREDEDVASAMGINVSRAKLLAFTLSAATGGVAGAIFATKVGTVFPNSFTVFVSINVLSLIIVGGMGSNPGIFVGALVLVGMPELLREFSEYRWLLYGVLLVFMMVNRPEGLLPSQVRQRELNEEKQSAAPVPIMAEAPSGD
ncbi:MAG: hypothetical protein OHK0046_31420 [Anaerolineae bacterium]